MWKVHNVVSFLLLIVSGVLLSESECFLLTHHNNIRVDIIGANKKLLQHGTQQQKPAYMDSSVSGNQRSKTVLVNVAAIGDMGLTNSTSSNESSSILEKVISQAAEGIGGKGGRVFDVNSLKRNLLQETMQAYKYEFFKLLNTPTSTEQEIVEKLSALVEGSPVRTTTDSNLLDGTWALAYTSKHSSVRNLREFFKHQQLRKNNSSVATKTPAMKRISGKGTLFQTAHHSFFLEELEDDDDPHVMEQISYFGGIYSIQRRSIVEALTRQTLRLKPISETKSFFGGWFSRESAVTAKPSVELLIVYADVNLCITARNEGSHNTYEVFTKNESWLDARRSFERRLAYTTVWLAGLFTRFLPGWSRRLKHQREEVDSMLREIYVDSAHLRVLKLGSALNEDDEAWDSVTDPFIHLSADERQKLLKAMSVREIERAGIQRRSKQRRDRWKPFFFNRRRRTFFNVPDLPRSGKSEEKGFTKPKEQDIKE